MSQTSMALPAPRALDDATTVEEGDHQQLLDALHDPDCRDVLEATSEAARSANELSADCDLPLSTTYRKLELLTEAGMLAERTRIRRSGKHASEYERRIDDIVISVTEAGTLQVAVSHRSEADSADGALPSFWS